MPKWCKTVIAILLLPVCWGAVQALWLVLLRTEAADTLWVATLSGAACWWVIYLLLPKPMWIYVFGHELTHALWVWAMGGKVKRFKASAKGGQVVVSKSNFAIALAPYFFPLYALLVVLIFAVGNWVWNWRAYAAWFHLLLGAAYAFHLTLTWYVLGTDQSDISQHGYLFSWVIIFLGNVGLLVIAIPLLSGKMEVRAALACWLLQTVETLQTAARLLHGLRKQ